MTCSLYFSHFESRQVSWRCAYRADPRLSGELVDLEMVR